MIHSMRKFKLLVAFLVILIPLFLFSQELYQDEEKIG